MGCKPLDDIAVFRLCWTEGGVPQNMKDANIVTLYNNKGGRGDGNNYCGISLLSDVGKLLACVVLKRLTRCLKTESIQNHIVNFELIDPPLTWYSPSDSCRRNAGNNSHSLWPS